MNNRVKPDAKEIQEYIDQLQKAQWLDKSRSWWPRFVFHFTNINNAVQIIESGKLFSRKRLEMTGGMVTDNASSIVIEQTEERWKEYVRLYFRPRTPTQNKNEGYRPARQRELNSHCPVPIYFLFDSKRLLSRENVSFSKGSLASSNASIYSDAKSFKEIPFELVYHDSWFDPSERAKIIHHRHAEVVVPHELDLDDLRYIWCRSEAEYHTLLNLLSPAAKDRWKNKIGSGKKGNMFFRSWIFVEKVDLGKERITFYFNVPVSECDPFHAKVIVREYWTGKEYVWENKHYSINEKLQLSLRNLKYPEMYNVRLYFDDQIMYSNDYYDDEIDLPF